MSDPIRALTVDEIEQYQQDGVIMAKGLLSTEWLARIETAVIRAMASPSPIAEVFSEPDAGFHMDAALFMSDKDIQDVVRYSSMAKLAQTLMNSHQIHFFYDQMFCKQPGNQTPTPWHHDLTFWPVLGDQICSMWIPLDHVTRESSGLEFVKGSHRWENEYKAISPMYNKQLVNPEHEDVPDIENNREAYDLIGWEMDPGDMLIFHPRTLHGSSGNYHLSQQRRAISFRWLGDDVSYAPTKFTMPWSAKNLTAGDRIAEPAFAQII